jgi:hypothetical protein
MTKVMSRNDEPQLFAGLELRVRSWGVVITGQLTLVF